MARQGRQYSGTPLGALLRSSLVGCYRMVHCKAKERERGKVAQNKDTSAAERMKQDSEHARCRAAKFGGVGARAEQKSNPNGPVELMEHLGASRGHGTCRQGIHKCSSGRRETGGAKQRSMVVTYARGGAERGRGWGEAWVQNAPIHSRAGGGGGREAAALGQQEGEGGQGQARAGGCSLDETAPAAAAPATIKGASASHPWASQAAGWRGG